MRKPTVYDPTTQELQTYDCVCANCLYFAEYGQLDDATMLKIENT